MKLYIVYFRTMQDSPDVEILCVTTNEHRAFKKFRRAKYKQLKWMKDVDEDSGDWAEARMVDFDYGEQYKPGDKIYLAIQTIWHEFVETRIIPYYHENDARRYVELSKEDRMEEYPGLRPFNEDESIEEAMHLEDPDVAVDVYFSIEEVVVE